MPDVPFPTPKSGDEAAVRRMLAAERIAIVGLSDEPGRPSYGIARYLLSAGKTIFPVNPLIATALGQKAYETLAAVPRPIDLVNVFRRPEFCADIVRAAIAAGAKGVWLQTGIVNAEAQSLALAAGVDFVQNQCIMVEHLIRKGR